MNSIRQVLTFLTISFLTIWLNSCASGPRQVEPRLIPSPSLPSPTTLSPSGSPSVTGEKLVKVTVYRLDSQCQGFIPQGVSVSVQKSLEDAIALTFSQEENRDFALGYRVIVDQKNAIVTIDFRVPSDAKRQIKSLSSCEQMALFGSLRQTLKSNRLWNIKQVKFTEMGKEISL